MDVKWIITFRAQQLCTTMLFIVTICLQGGCVGERAVFGNIPPSTFQFKTVIEYDGRAEGGWQIAQVIILLGRLSAMFPRAATCDVEVGLPVRNRQQGFIPVEKAQTESAMAADKAAREILQQHEKPTASICDLFRKTMEYYLRDEKIGTIRGARVTGFVNGFIAPRRTFPPTRGR